jgi:hypothetical protein
MTIEWQATDERQDIVEVGSGLLPWLLLASMATRWGPGWLSPTSEP